MKKNKINRVFLIVLDSFGIGELPDAELFGDKGSNTLRAVAASKKFNTPKLKELGLFNIDSVKENLQATGLDVNKLVEVYPKGSFARMAEKSKGKDTTIGHWEIAGIISENKLPTFPQGFPKEFLDEFSKRTGRGYLCNKPYSGTEVIKKYGKEHMESGDLIIYTSADSVFQIAAHEEIVPVEELYKYCEIARDLLQGDDLGVGRVIARPFIGEASEDGDKFVRTSNRHDFSLTPAKNTMLDEISKKGLASIGVGKIYDIFAGKSIGQSYKIKDNNEGMYLTIKLIDENFEGLCFVNLVDFDMKFGHRNDVDGYANALSEFDEKLAIMMDKLKDDDVLILTADHGCDPSTPSTDHSREYVPMIIFGNHIKEGINLGTRETFSDIAKSIGDIFDLEGNYSGESFFNMIYKD